MSSNTKFDIQTTHFYPEYHQTPYVAFQNGLIATQSVPEEVFQNMIEGQCPVCGSTLNRVTVNGEQWGQCSGSGYPYYHCRTVR